MKLRLKALLLAWSVGVVAFGSGACLFRLLGDMVGDQLVANVVQ